LETPLRSLFDRFRSKPEWESPDPVVRAAAVLRLSHEEHDLIATLARDEDPRVRRAAVKKLHDLALLAVLATGDADAGVRDEAASALVAMALHAQDAETGSRALSGLQEARHLLAVAKGASNPATRRVAVDKIADPRALCAVAREAQDASLRLEAVARIQESAALQSLAQNCEHKAVGLAAVEKLGDRGALEAVAARAKVGAVARRARARLDSEPEAATGVSPPSPGPVPDDAAEREAYERALVGIKEAESARARAIAERESWCERLEAAAAEAARDALDEARAAWEGLSPLGGNEAERLAERFEAAAAACRSRHEAWTAAGAVREALAGIADEAATLAFSDDPKTARDAWGGLQKKWKDTIAGVAGVGDLEARFEASARHLAEREAQSRAGQERAEASNLTRLTTLVTRLEGLATRAGLTLRDAERGVREAKDAIDDPGPLPTRKDREALLARLEKARKALYPRLAELRVDTEWKRWANAGVQESLCQKAEALASEVDLDRAARDLRDLDAQWKVAAEVDRAQGESLWARFKGARDEVKARCDAYFASKAQELAENLAKKEALCEKAEALRDSTEWLKTADELKRLQAEWKAIGPVAPARSRAVWERFRQPCDHFFTRREANLKQRKEEWSQNEARKAALCEQAEAVAESSDWEAATAEIKRLQGEWKAIGPVKKTRSEALWQRFRTASDRYFDRYKRRDEIARATDASVREALCASLEALVPVAGAEVALPEGLADRVGQIQANWRQAGPLPRELSALGDRFRQAVLSLVASFPDGFRGTELDPEATRKKMEKLCARVEALAPTSDGPPPSLAEQLKDALATNTIAGKGEGEARRKARAEEVKAARAAWDRLEPLPGSEAAALRDRFEAACRRAVA
jgi:hypothetical protein